MKEQLMVWTCEECHKPRTVIRVETKPLWGFIPQCIWLCLECYGRLQRDLRHARE